MSEEKKNEILGKEKELKSDEMEKVAGGGDCVCVMGGGGTADGFQKTCACVMGGGGEVEDNLAEVLGHKSRCVCFVAGTGEDI